jgi:hypothetical protein
MKIFMAVRGIVTMVLPGGRTTAQIHECENLCKSSLWWRVDGGGRQGLS